MKRQTKILALTTIVFSLALQQASALVTGYDLGTANPPATLGGFTMTPYEPGSIAGADYYAHLTNGNDDGTGTGSWATWGQSYTGRGYVSLNGTKALTLSLTGVSAVYFYMEPNQFADFLMTATDSSGVSVSTDINGSYGSGGVGFTTDSGFLSSISVVSSDITGFAIGQFGIDDGSLTGAIGVPDTGVTLNLLGLALAGLAVIRRKFR